jgi:acetoin utilization deacetylase AcuC-like enzyme
VGLHHNPGHLLHDVPGHPEQPARVEAILARLREVGIERHLLSISHREATDADLLLAHVPSLLRALERAQLKGGAWLDDDTAVLPGSVTAARQAVGGALQAVDLILDGALEMAFCVDRPPGHHATPAQAMGFCLFNQVGIAARHALRRRGLARVAIVDFDVHHGNGTQDIFWTDDTVLYISLHQFPLYPGTGTLQEIGDGTGTIINLPLPAGSGNAEYLACFDRVVGPALRRFAPELILVSAGFDAHLGDPLAGMAMTAAGYASMAQRLRDLAGELCASRLCFVLEGGYLLHETALAVEAVLRVLLELPLSTGNVAAGVGEPRPDVQALIEDAAQLHGLS